MTEEKISQQVNPSDLSTVNLIIYNLGLLLSGLLEASRATSDPAKLMQFNNEYMAVQGCLNQAAQAQAAANDMLFKQATSVLKVEAKQLENMVGQIKNIVDDVALAGRLIGYATEVISLIARL